MAAPKKPSNRPKKAAAKKVAAKRPAAKKPAAKKAAAKRKAPAKKPAAKRTASATARKSPAKRKAPPATARKTAPKSGTGEWAKAADEAQSQARGMSALAAKAEATGPSLRPARKRSYGRWAAVAGLIAAVVVVILLVTGGSDDNDTTVADTTPATTPTLPAETPTSPAVTSPPAAAPAPAAKAGVRSETCDPIIGSGTANSGKTYKVTSSATDGDPADCGEAHDTLLSALQGSGTTIGDWTCKTDPSGTTVASCTSAGGRTIKATG